MIKAFKQAIPILVEIENSGYEAYFVGGSVRDYLLNKEIEDVDIASSATPEEIKQIFPKTVDIGIEHGTVLVIFQGQTYEITTFRSESEYEDYRRPKNVQFIRSLYDDLKRRDFTMNAIAMDRNGKLIDPFSGHEALHKKMIQTVGEPDERFSEDALRMMRAIRFVSQLSFSIEEKTFLALKKNGLLLDQISVERKTKEFEKLLCGKERNKAIQILIEAEFHLFLPGLKNRQAGLKSLSEFFIGGLDLIEMWALLIYCLHISSIEIIPFLREWKLSNQKMKEVEKVCSYLGNRLDKEWDELSLYHAGIETSLRVERIFNVLTGNTTTLNISHLNDLYNSLAIKKRGDLDVTGQDLMLWYDSKGGPWLKELLEKIEIGILQKQVQNAKEAIREWLLTCNPK